MENSHAIVNRQSSIVNRQSSIVNRQSSNSLETLVRLSTTFLISFFLCEVSFAADCVSAAVSANSEECQCKDVGSNVISFVKREASNGNVVSSDKASQCLDLSDTACTVIFGPSFYSPQYYKNTDGSGYFKCDFDGIVSFTNPVFYEPLLAPTGLTANVVSATQIDLSWTDNSNNETGFKIFNGGSGGTPVHTTAANATSYSVTGLSCSNDSFLGYIFEVVATSASGDSTAAATTPVTIFVPLCSGGSFTPIPASIDLNSKKSAVPYGREINVTE